MAPSGSQSSTEIPCVGQRSAGELYYTLPNFKTQHLAPGDSGAPVLVWTIGGWTLVGVHSAHFFSSEVKLAFGGALTAELFEWIDDTLGDWGDSVKLLTLPVPLDPPKPKINEDAAEAWIFSRLIGSEEGERGVPHLGVLTHSSVTSLGLFDFQGDEPEFDQSFGLFLADRLHDRADVHMKTSTRWVPYQELTLKNQPAPDEFPAEAGLLYFNTVQLTDAALEALLQEKESIKLHVRFSGDSHRTVLTFPLRVPIQ